MTGVRLLCCSAPRSRPRAAAARWWGRDTWSPPPTALMVSWDWWRAGHVTTVLVSDWWRAGHVATVLVSDWWRAGHVTRLLTSNWSLPQLRAPGHLQHLQRAGGQVSCDWLITMLISDWLARHQHNARLLLKDLYQCNYSAGSWGGKFLDFIRNPSMSVSLNYSLQVNVKIAEPYILTVCHLQRTTTRCGRCTTCGCAPCARDSARTGPPTSSATIRSTYAVTVITLTLS